MGQPAGGAELLVDAVEHLLADVAKQLAANYLERDHPLQMAVPRLVDDAGRTLAEPLEQEIRPHHQRMMPTLRQLFELVRREPGALLEESCECPEVAEATRELRRARLALLR